MTYLEYNIGEGRTKLHIKVMPMGADLVILVTGGNAHIGSIAVAVPRPSLDDPNKVSATTSVFNITGHMDDHLSQPLANEIAAETGRKVVVVAGFHLDNITPAEIENILKNLESVSTILKQEVQTIEISDH